MTPPAPRLPHISTWLEHVDIAIWSAGGEQDAIDIFVFQLFCNLWGIDRAPGAGIWWVTLIPHEGVGVLRQASDDPLSSQLLKALNGQQDVDII